MARFRRRGTNWEGRTWVTTPALNALMDEIEAAFPARHATDGTVASKNHDRNSPNSDHRPYPHSDRTNAKVNAVDSGDRDDGFLLAEALRASRDPRIRYVIFDRRIFSSYARPGRAPYEWAAYSGASHATHVHVSILRTHESDGRAWNLSLTPTIEDTMLPLVRTDGWTSGPRPHKRADVALLQALFGLDYGDQQGFYGDQTAADIAAKLGRSAPVNEFGYAEAQEAAAKGIFVGAGQLQTTTVNVVKSVKLV